MGTDRIELGAMKTVANDLYMDVLSITWADALRCTRRDAFSGMHEKMACSACRVADTQ